jgi:tellurite resistance protein TerC
MVCYPLFACVITIEVVDIIFAMDSIPAILSNAQTPLLAFSSDIFAIIGLRSMYVYQT